MPFRQRVARKLGETVSNAPTDPMPPTSSSSSPSPSPLLAPSPSSSSTSLSSLSSLVQVDPTPAGSASDSRSIDPPFLSIEDIAIRNVVMTPVEGTIMPPEIRAKFDHEWVSCLSPRQFFSPARQFRRWSAGSASAIPSRLCGDRPTGSIGPIRAMGACRRSLRLTQDPYQLSPEKSYLSYYDILLTYEDVKALKSDWLTDNNIAFWEEWLEREVLPKYPQARIVLMRPSMAFLLMRNSDTSSLKDNLPNMSRVTHIFIPINDNRNLSRAEGGSHWSLLLVSTIDRVAFHYDSLGGANRADAKLCVDKLRDLYGVNLKFHQLDDCPQQENNSDCGVFVCILMRHLLVKRLLNANAREKVSMSMANKMVDSFGGRKEMLRIIESLRKEGERRRSGSPMASSSHTPPRIE